MSNFKTGFLAVLVMSVVAFLTACSGSSSSSGGGGDTDLQTAQPTNGNIVVILGLGAGCGGTYDMYHNPGLANGGQVGPSGIRSMGTVGVTVAPGNHRFALMPKGVAFNPNKTLDDDALNVSSSRTHRFTC